MSYWDLYWEKKEAMKQISCERIADSILDSVDPYARNMDGAEVAELGGGGGRIAVDLAKKTGCKMTLVDFSKPGLKLAKKLFETNGIPVNIVHGNVMKIGDLGKKFHMSYSSGLIEHFGRKDRKKLAKVHYDVLDEDGVSSITFPNGSNYAYRLSKVVKKACGSWTFMDERNVRRYEIEHDMKSAGFDVVGRGGYDLISCVYLPIYLVEKKGSFRFALNAIRQLDEIKNPIYRKLLSYFAWNLSIGGKKGN